MKGYEVRYKAAEAKSTVMMYECKAGPFEDRKRAEECAIQVAGRLVCEYIRIADVEIDDEE